MVNLTHLLKCRSVTFLVYRIRVFANRVFCRCLSRIVPLEAKAAKRRAKRKHKKDMEAERLRRDGLLMDVVEHIKDEDVEEMRDSFVSGAELEAMNQCLMDELAAVETELGRKKHLIDVPMSDENGSGSHLDDDGLELTLMRDL